MSGRSLFHLFFGLAAADLIATATPVRAADGVIVTQSANDVKTTVDKLQKVLTEKGITIFARIDHAAGAKSAGQTLRPMEVLIFGNPKLGTPLMLKSQEIGLDLPLKVLVFQAENGTTQIAYTDPAYMAKRYGVTEPANVLEQMAGALKSFTAAAAAK
jgi:uncharacterized protein (DUF302 family)